jgi:hypothetical protein
MNLFTRHAGLHQGNMGANGSGTQHIVSKKQFQALKARNITAQGEGCGAAETLG